jgi:hypothetical protein
MLLSVLTQAKIAPNGWRVALRPEYTVRKSRKIIHPKMWEPAESGELMKLVDETSVLLSIL